MLTAAYADFTGESTDLGAAVLNAKRRTFTRNLAGELEHLTHLAFEIAQADVATRDLGSDTLRRAIVEVGSAFPVYRSYVDAGGAAPEDRELIAQAIEQARAGREVEDEDAFALLAGLLTLADAPPERQTAALAFALRFQQTSGPLMAKALEDTVFYRFNRLISLNEVGGDPQFFGAPLSEVHAAFARRQEVAPHALSTTATHDTKRGEDARARIAAISEVPQLWGEAVARWSEANSGLRAESEGQAVPDRNTEWLYYQSLLGAWPAYLSASDAAGLSSLAGRMSAFMIKAAREAKLTTSWTHPDEAYEASLTRFVTASLDANQSRVFLADFARVAAPLMAAGAVTSLTQLVTKLLAPGVPDLYRGTELWDLSLVDPDNRTPVDYGAREQVLRGTAQVSDLLDTWQDGAVKFAVLRAGLAVRKAFGPDIDGATYLPLAAVGPAADHVFAFARTFGNKVVVVIGARFAVALLNGRTSPRITAEAWGDTHIICPLELNISGLRSVLSPSSTLASQGRIDVGRALAACPVAILTSGAV